MRHIYPFCHSWYWRPAYSHSCATRNTRYETRRPSGPAFGVRRPLRFLSYELDLSEQQTRRMASALNAIKNQREQSALDQKRSASAIAQLVMDGAPTLDDISEVLESRNQSAAQLNAEIAQAVVQIADMLDEDQRERFADLLINGTIAL
ncbi:MAG: hypothetical protein AAGI44_00285 [Pseudomonadota bacterium]